MRHFGWFSNTVLTFFLSACQHIVKSSMACRFPWHYQKCSSSILVKIGLQLQFRNASSIPLSSSLRKPLYFYGSSSRKCNVRAEVYDKKEEKTRDPNLGSVSMSWSHCTHCGKTQCFVQKLNFDANISKIFCLHFVQLFIYIFSSNFCCLFTISAVCLHFCKNC